MLLNARSIKKREAIQRLTCDLVNERIDIVFLTETWLTPDFDSSLLYIPNYSLCRHDRSDCSSTKSKGGGVAAFYKNSVDLEQLHVPSKDKYEVLWLKHVAVSTVLFAVLYYPPKIGRQSEYATYISDTLVQLLSVYGDAIIIICGDFNDFDFSCVAEDFGLTDLYHGSTRGGHQLDHVYCSSAQYDGSSFTTLSKSDHLAIIASPRVSLPVAKSLVSFRDQRPRNQDSFDRAMDICDFSHIEQIEDPNVALSLLFDDLNILIDQFCPIRTVKLSTKDPFYISPLVKFLLKKRNKLFRKRNFRRAESITKQITEMIRNKISRNRGDRGSRKWWNIINEQRGKSKETQTSLFDSNDINKHFASISTVDNYVSPTMVQSNELLEFTLHEVYYSLLNLKKSAVGHDGLPYWVFRSNAHVLALPMMHIYNLCLRQAMFPDLFKIAEIRALPKKSKVTSLDDLRPISVTPILARHFGRLIYTKYIKRAYNKWLEPLLFGFRQQSSTEYALLRILHECRVLEANGCDYARIMSVDLSKAFDRIPHHFVLQQMRKIPGIPIAVCNLVSSFLHGRKQFVSNQNDTSEIIQINCGMPQGTVLGPVCFNVGYADLSVPPFEMQYCRTIKYADDANAVCGGKQGKDFSDEVLSHIHHWCQDHNFILNQQKTKSLVLQYTNVSPAPSTIASSNENCILGVVFDDRLTFQNHVKSLQKRISGDIYLLNKLKHMGYPQKDLVVTYQSLIVSELSYCCVVLGGCSKGLLEILDKLQRRCVRLNIIPTYTPMKDLIAQKDSQLMRKLTSDESHILHEILPKRCDYATIKLRNRLPKAPYTQKAMLTNIFPARSLRNFYF